MSQNKFGIFHDKWNIPNFEKIVCPRFKMEYSKNFKQKKYVPGARKIEPGDQVKEEKGEINGFVQNFR